MSSENQAGGQPAYISRSTYRELPMVDSREIPERVKRSIVAMLAESVRPAKAAIEIHRLTSHLATAKTAIQFYHRAYVVKVWAAQFGGQR